MKNLLTLLTLSFFASCNAGVFTHRSGDEKFHYEGRWLQESEKTASCSFPGSSVTFSFRGTKLSVFLQQSTDSWTKSYFDVIIDDKPSDSLDINANSWHLIFESEKDETHTVTLFKRNEPWMGEAKFRGIELVGELLPYSSNKKNKLLFLGASWETGFGNVPKLDWETSKTTSWTPEGMDHYYSYPSILAQSTESEYTCVCFGGKGLMRDYQGDTINQIPDMLHKTKAIDNSSTWNHQDFYPNVIIIQLGGNDFSSGIPDEEKFTNAYTNLIDTLHLIYPKSYIVISEINLSSNDTIYGLTYHTYIENVRNHYSNDSVLYWNYEEKNITIWGEDSHPQIDTFKKIANDLKTFLKENTSLTTLSVNRISQNTDVKIYPNPSKDYIYWDEKQTFQILDSKGRILEKNFSNQANIANLAKGLYIIKFESTTIEFIKE